jgi:tetratricopeptide (TPR) repeat protein
MTPQRQSKIDQLDARLSTHWEVISEFTLHQMRREVAQLLPKSDLETTVRLHHIAGSISLRLGEWKDAVERFQAALDIAVAQERQDLATFWINLGVAQASAGDSPQALESLLRASDLSGDDAWKDVVQLTNLIVVLVALRRHQDAVSMYSAAEAAADMDNYDHLYRLATAAAMLQRYHVAVEFLGQILRRSSGEAGTALELLERHHQHLSLTTALLEAIDFVAGFEQQKGQFSLLMQPVLKVDILEVHGALQRSTCGALMAVVGRNVELPPTGAGR